MGGPPPLSGTPVVAFGVVAMLTGAFVFTAPYWEPRLIPEYSLHDHRLGSKGKFTARAFHGGLIGFGLGLVLGARFAPAWTIPLALGCAFVSLVGSMWYQVFAEIAS